MNNKKYYLFEMQPTSLNIISILILFVVVIFTVLLGKFSIIFDNYGISLILMLPYLVLHEILHSVAYVIHGADFKNITYGAHMEKGILCCLCKQNITKKNILISLVYPLIFIGIFTYVIGILTNCGVLIFLSILNISGCSGDIIMFIALSRLENFEFSEYDNPLAFGLYTKEDLSNKKMFGLKYLGTQDELEKKDLKKVRVSKVSYIYFAIMILVGLLCML